MSVGSPAAAPATARPGAPPSAAVPAVPHPDAPAPAAPALVAAGPDGSLAPEVVGFVEAVTGEAVLGWAWSPGRPELRVTVSALLDGTELGRATADGPRRDLAENGIGDGRHAFRLPLPPAARARAAELRVVGHGGAGAAVPLGRPPAAEGVAERLDRLQRGLDMVVASQRVLHRNLQAALLEAAGGDQAGARAELAGQVHALELFVLRLDERLAALAPAPVGGPRSAAGLARGAAAAVLALGLLGGGLGLWRSLAG